jgi:hypothetical protein
MLTLCLSVSVSPAGCSALTSQGPGARRPLYEHSIDRRSDFTVKTLGRLSRSSDTGQHQGAYLQGGNMRQGSQVGLWAFRPLDRSSEAEKFPGFRPVTTEAVSLPT